MVDEKCGLAQVHDDEAWVHIHQKAQLDGTAIEVLDVCDD